MTKKKPRRRGLRPTPTKLAEMHADGYGTPAEVAKVTDVSGSCVYTWVKAGALQPFNGKDPTKKLGPNVWVLFAAAAAKAGVRHCRRCGCTEKRACAGGCSWAGDPTICSACERKVV